MNSSQWNSLRRWFGRYLNGGRGVISLFLAFIMAPFLSCSLLLVESARYQSAAELMNELMDSAGLSAESNFDTYLEDRFGLLAFDQESSSVSDIYSQYINKNENTLGNNVTVEEAFATGNNPLYDKDVFIQQIIDAYQVSAPIEMGEDLSNLKDLISALTKGTKYEALNDFSEEVSQASNMLKAVEGVLEAALDVENKVNDFQDELKKYKEAASTFKSKTSDVVSAMRSAKNDLTEEEEYRDIFGKTSVRNAISEAESARNKYRDEADSMASKTESVKKAMLKIAAEAKKLESSAAKYKSASQKRSEKKEEGENKGTGSADTSVAVSTDYALMMGTGILTALPDLVATDYANNMHTVIEALKNQKQVIGKVRYGRIPSNTYDYYYVTEYTDTSSGSFKSNYGAKDLDSLVPANLISAIKTACSSYVKHSSGNDTSVWEKVKNIVNALGDVFGMSILYDNHLNAKVSGVNNMGDTLDGKMFCASCTTFNASVNNYIGAFKDIASKRPISAAIKLIKASVEMFASVLTLIGSIIALIVQIVGNIVHIASSGWGSLGNQFMLSCYGVYNNPNRTNYNSGKSIYGYKYSDIYSMVGAGPNSGTGGALANLGSLMSGGGGDPARAFRGAEAEYLFTGSDSEMTNQVGFFFYLFVLRLALDAPVIMTSSELTAETSAVPGIGPMIIRMIILVLEPFIDCVLLVNGADLQLIKETPFFTFSGAARFATVIKGIKDSKGKKGMDDLKQSAISSLGLPELVKTHETKKLKDKWKGWESERKKKVDIRSWELGYTDYLFVMTFIFRNDDVLATRLQNIVRTEASANYGNDGYSLQMAYTGLYGTVSYRLNAMFSLDALNSGNPFEIVNRRYSGY